MNWSLCYVLTFWPGQKCHSRWRTGRKWHILMAVMRGNHVGWNWLMKWDEVKKIPLYSHRLTHRKRVTHPDRQISEEIAEAWRRVHITAWEFEGNIRPTNWTEGRQARRRASSIVREEIDECSRESQHPGQWIPGLRLSSHGERERHNADGHNFGVKIFQLISVSSSLSRANVE